MLFVIDARLSELPCVERVWTARSERAGEFLSVAASNCELVVSRYQGQPFLTVRGPETKMTTAECPAQAEWFGIRFRVGTFLPQFPATSLSDRRDVTLARRSDAIFLAQWIGVGVSDLRQRRYVPGAAAQKRHRHT